MADHDHTHAPTLGNTPPREWYLRAWMPAAIAAILILGQIAWYALALWLYPPSASHGGDGVLSTGEFGDLFGGYNALVSGVALAFIVYSIIQQSKDLDLQRDALEGQRKELELQRGEMKAQREEAEYARRYRTEPVVMLENPGYSGPANNALANFQLRNYSDAVAWDVRFVVAVRWLPTRGWSPVKPGRLPVLSPGEASPAALKPPPLDLTAGLLWVSVRYRNVAGGRFQVLQAFRHNNGSLESAFFRVNSGDNVHDAEFFDDVAAAGFQ